MIRGSAKYEKKMTSRTGRARIPSMYAVAAALSGPRRERRPSASATPATNDSAIEIAATCSVTSSPPAMNVSVP